MYDHREGQTLEQIYFTLTLHQTKFEITIHENRSKATTLVHNEISTKDRTIKRMINLPYINEEKVHLVKNIKFTPKN